MEEEEKRKEPKHKRVRRNQIGPPLDVDEDNMEEEEKRQEVLPPQNRKRKLDPIGMDVSPIVSNVPKINTLQKVSSKDSKTEIMKITPSENPPPKKKGLFGSVDNSLFASKPGGQFQFNSNLSKEVSNPPKQSMDFGNSSLMASPLKEKAEDSSMASPPKKKKRKIDLSMTSMSQTRATDPPKKRLALSQDTDIQSTQENSQKPPEKKPVPKPQPPKKESYMSRMIRERGEKTEKLYKEHAPDKVAKVDGLVKKYTYVRIHDVYLKVCKKYSVKAEAEFDGTDPDVMDMGEAESAAPKISGSSTGLNGSGSNSTFKFNSKPEDSGPKTGFKFGDGSSNALGSFKFSMTKKTDTKNEENNKKPPLAKKPLEFNIGKKDEEKKDDAKPKGLTLGIAFDTSNKKSPFAFNSKSSTSSKPADKPTDLFGAAPSPNSFSLLSTKGKAVDFLTGSTNSTQISSKPKSSGNPFAMGIKNSNSPQISINFGGMGGGMKSNNSNNNRMSIASDMGGNNGGMSGNNGGSNPFANGTNDR